MICRPSAASVGLVAPFPPGRKEAEERWLEFNGVQTDAIQMDQMSSNS
jgi:hypothetical protein